MKRPSLEDLCAWRKDNHSSFSRAEITKEEYERVRYELEVQELAIHVGNKKRAATRERKLESLMEKMRMPQ